MAYLFLIAAFICNAGANILLKLSTLKGFSFGSVLAGQFSIGVVYAGAAIALFGLNLLFYLAALEKVPLSVGYPIMVGMTFLITIGASLVLGEKVNLVQAGGMALILLGLLIATRAATV